MNVFIVYWHPEKQSFNGAMFNKAIDSCKANGHQVDVSDLYEMTFDPVSSRHNFASIKDPDYFKQQIEEIHATETNSFSELIEAELKKLEWCDLMIWQFPLWWFGLPATLKGWVDRVFAMGRTYGNGRIYETGVFSGKKALLSLTTGGPEEAYQADGFNGDISSILRPIHRGMLEFVGFEVLAPHIVFGPAHLEKKQREEHLIRYGLRLASIENETPINVGRY